ncbi:MAG: sulfotransferase [Clostridiales bacterium]|nr:sulfotransferase [Clostridiales bacterium]
MELVFVIGVARTGSKIYRNIINNNTNINILNELHYLSPRWIRKDFITSTRNIIKKSEESGDLTEFIDYLYSNGLKGNFWTTDKWNVVGPPNNITGIEKNELRKELERTGLGYDRIFEVLIKKHTENQRKNIGGAKFPVELSRVPKLRDWFPESKLIHITRDPRGIYASMIFGDLKDNRGLKALLKPIRIIYRMLYLRDQYNKAFKIHEKYMDDERYFLSRFEDMVTKPEINIKKLCTFLEVPYYDEMLYPPVVNSSFDIDIEEKKKGFDRSAASRWKDKLSGFEKWIIGIILKKQMRTFGYLN